MKRKGFTVVELLVIVTIIGILASLITAAAVAARRRAKIAAISTEISQLDMACKSYKERMGEYPPDFIPDGSSPVYYSDSGPVMRHLSRAFPRYTPGVYSGGGGGWAGFRADVKKGWGIDIGSSGDANACSPAMALTFWLGGMPDWINSSTPALGVKGFRGFSANPINPFDSSTSRIGPFFDFKVDQIAYVQPCGGKNELCYWPTGACGNKSSSPIVYLRANNGTYYREGTSTPYVRRCLLSPCHVYPAIDGRTGAWINPQSFQIFCAGLDVTYGNLVNDGYYGVLKFPYGTYGNIGDAGSDKSVPPETYDDITNFSNGTLEDAIP